MSSAATTDGAPADPDGTRPGGGRFRPAAVITLVAVAALLGAWVYVLFIYDPGRLIDELPDRTFPDRAEQICAASVAELRGLPPAQDAATADQRADTVARSNVILSAMVRDLRSQLGTVPSEQLDGVTEWVDDWETYLGNRERYVEDLRVDDDARFLESPKGSPTKGVTRAINGFAEVNEMESCTTPGDLS